MNLVYETNNTLYHHGVKGMKWGQRRAQNRVAKAENYLGRKIQPNDGISKDGSNITRKRLKNIKQWDEQEARYKAIKKKDDPIYDYVRGYDLKYRNALGVKDVNRIMKKMEKDPSLNVMSEIQKAHRTKAGKKAVGRTLTVCGSMLIGTALLTYAHNR